MAYIGKVSITSEWEKLEDLIQAQVDGQSSFAFDTSKKYGIMVDAHTVPMFGAYICNASSKPDAADDGEFLTECVPFGVYEPESGSDLWVKTRGNSTDVKISVSEN